jgi:hypothetical protein
MPQHYKCSGAEIKYNLIKPIALSKIEAVFAHLFK